jgi:transposase
MRVLHERCCGLDIHKKFVVACLLTASPEGSVHKEIRTYSAMTNDLLALADWLRAEACGPVVMESTGSYWRPVYNLVEEQCEVVVVNADHVKAVPGRKTDVKDAEWLADLLRHGLLRASFIPAPAQRHLRDLTRYRILLVDERARLTNRLQAVLEDANIKLASVVTDLRGLSARESLQRLLEGETDARALAELAREDAGQAGRPRPGGRWPATGSSCLPPPRTARPPRVSGCGHCACGRRAYSAPRR